MDKKMPGMDESQAEKDRAGFTTTIENVTGKGTTVPAMEGGGPEVGLTAEDVATPREKK